MRNGRIFLYAIAGKGWSPFTIGSFEDLKLAGITPEEGLRLKFYNDDADDAGNRDDLFFEGTIHFSQSRGWGASVDPESFRAESEEREAQRGT
jgi:hypothetical protein